MLTLKQAHQHVNVTIAGSLVCIICLEQQHESWLVRRREEERAFVDNYADFLNAAMATKEQSLSYMVASPLPKIDKGDGEEATVEKTSPGLLLLRVVSWNAASASQFLGQSYFGSDVKIFLNCSHWYL